MIEIMQGYDTEGKPVSDLDKAVFIIRARYDDEGELLTEEFLEAAI